jgi:hypothetical protein
MLARVKKVTPDPMRSRLKCLWLPSTAALLALGLMAGAVLALFPSATRSGQLIAMAAITGGLIAAAGTALAIYLMISNERAAESEKIEATLRMEVAEFARHAVSRLVLCQRVLVDRVRIPPRDFPALMEMPEAVCYKAAAHHIGRLPYGPLLVIFHGRIAEAMSMARTYATPTHVPDGSAETWIKDRAATKMATAWLIVCETARNILRTVPERIPNGAAANRLEKLDKAITHAKAVLDHPAVPGIPEPAQTTRPELQPTPPWGLGAVDDVLRKYMLLSPTEAIVTRQIPVLRQKVPAPDSIAGVDGVG